MYYFIVNPVSSSGKGLRLWQEAREILDDGNVEYESFILEGPGEAAELARFLSLNRTPCTIVVVGGDGTINEFLSGLVTCQGITFGYIPTGSGNDFARGMRLPSRMEDIMAMILSPSKFRNINIGVTSSGGQKKYFAVSSGMGYDAAVCYESYRSPAKYLLNKLHAGIQHLFFLFPSVIFFDSEMDYLFKNNNTRLKIITDFILLKTNYLCKIEPSTHPKVQTFFGTL